MLKPTVPAAKFEKCGFEVFGRIKLRDLETGKIYR